MVVSKHYNLHPSFEALIFRDGSLSPVFILRDKASAHAQKQERYFVDLYHLFLNKFARLSYDPGLSEEEAQKLKRLFEELLRAKINISRQE